MNSRHKLLLQIAAITAWPGEHHDGSAMIRREI